MCFLVFVTGATEEFGRRIKTLLQIKKATGLGCYPASGLWNFFR